MKNVKSVFEHWLKSHYFGGKWGMKHIVKNIEPEI